MYKHHEETIKNISQKLAARDDVLGLLICGSIAHGFENEFSDVDIMIIVSDEDYKKRFETGDLVYWETNSCTYKDGYIDGKYISPSFMKKVAESGSEPARFAFEGVKPAFVKIDGIPELLDQIVRYPIEKKNENISRFYAQLQAWKWYFYEAVKRNNEYLIYQSISNIVLFGGRIILAYNELLYPYHKWFLRVLENAKHKPENFIQLIRDIYTNKDSNSIEEFFYSIEAYAKQAGVNDDWPRQFMFDSEFNWLYDKTPVSDI